MRITIERQLLAVVGTVILASAGLVAGCGTPRPSTGSAGAGPGTSPATGATGATGPTGSAGSGGGPGTGGPASGGASGQATAPGGGASGGGSATGVPAFAHVYVLVMENHGASSIVGAADAPYLNSLIARSALAQSYSAVGSPSQPNYLAIFSGSTHGIGDDGVHDLAFPTLADQLEAAGKDWRVVAENVPGGCFTGAVASGGTDGPGTYARKHEPAISFTQISSNPTRCAKIVDLGGFDPGAAAFELIVPNLCHDMHDCSVAQGDAFLASFVPRILASAGWQDRGVLFIVFDEGGGGPIPAIVLAPNARPGFRSSVPHDHFSLLHTIEDGLGLPCLGHACTANTLAELFQ